MSHTLPSRLLVRSLASGGCRISCSHLHTTTSAHASRTAQNCEAAPCAPRASTSKITIESELQQIAREQRSSRSCNPTRRTPALIAQRSFSSSAKAGRGQTVQEAEDAAESDRGGQHVSERLLRKYAELPPNYVTIKGLTRFGKPPLSEEALIASAEATRAELPHRLARRVLAHRKLPFIVGRNPYIAQVYDLYESSFETLSALPPIRTMADNESFTKTLDELVEDHSDNVPVLAKGFSECKPYLSEDEISTFFDRAVRNRIGIRLIAEQHLALSFLTERKGKTSGGRMAKDSSHIGIVDMQCSMYKIIKSCGYHVETLCEGAYGRAPDLKVDGHVDAKFAYIPSHIEYILNELLKNAFRATAEKYKDRPAYQDLPPVRVTISKAQSGPTITIRVRDAGGGIPPEILPKVNAYAFTTVDSSSGSNSSGEGGSAGDPDVEEDHRDEGPYGIQNAGGGVGLDDVAGLQSTSGHLAGLGFGLPLSKLHCEYFGGSLQLVSLYGHGTDAFLVLKGEAAA